MTELKLGKYQHFKGNFYEVIGVARHSETLEELVVYRALYESKEFGKNSLWVRPKKMFLENVIADGKEVPRFKFIGTI
jgi:cyclomaltodextrinase / maltogenic alpha-amylase / neopullulanase